MHILYGGLRYELACRKAEMSILVPNIKHRGQKDLSFKSATKHMHARCSQFCRRTITIMRDISLILFLLLSSMSFSQTPIKDDNFYQTIDTCLSTKPEK
jgi:hypothetical protein